MQKEFKIKDKVFRLIDLETEFNFGMSEKGEELYYLYNQALFNITKENRNIFKIISENKLDIATDTETDKTNTGMEIMKYMTAEDMIQFSKSQHILQNNPKFVFEVMTLITTEKGVEPDIDNFETNYRYWKKAPAMLNIEIVKGGYVDKFLTFFTKLITVDLNLLQEQPETEKPIKPKPNLKSTKK